MSFSARATLGALHQGLRIKLKSKMAAAASADIRRRFGDVDRSNRCSSDGGKYYNHNCHELTHSTTL